MDSEDSLLKITIFYKQKSLTIESKEIITLKEIKEKSIRYFNISGLFKDSAQFIVKDDDNINADKIYISSEDDIIKNSIEKDSQNLIIELQLILNNDKGTKTILMNKDKDKNSKSIIDNNIKNEKEKNTFKIICNECIYIEGDMTKINELKAEIEKYKLISNKRMQILVNSSENYKRKIKILEEDNFKLKIKIDKSNKDFELIKKKKEEYIKELEEKIKEYENSKDKIKKLIKGEKVIDFNIQSSLEKSNFEIKLNQSNKSTLKPIEKESSPFPQNSRDSNYNNKNDLNSVDSFDKGILEIEKNLNDNFKNINIEEFISKNDKKRKFLSRNEEINKKNNISNLNPKTEIKRMRNKKKLDIDTITKIRKQCGNQVKNYSDEKIQKILDDNGGNYLETITDIMFRLSRILSE